MKIRFVIPVVVIMVCGVVACSSSTSPSDSLLAGTWVGTLSDAPVSGSLMVTLADSGSSLTGTWSSNTVGGGTLSGSVNGSTVTMTLTSGVPTSCGFSITANINGTQMTGTDSSQTCAVAVSGTVTLMKQ